MDVNKHADIYEYNDGGKSGNAVLEIVLAHGGYRIHC